MHCEEDAGEDVYLAASASTIYTLESLHHAIVKALGTQDARAHETSPAQDRTSGALCQSMGASQPSARWAEVAEATLRSRALVEARRVDSEGRAEEEVALDEASGASTTFILESLRHDIVSALGACGTQEC